MTGSFQHVIDLAARNLEGDDGIKDVGDASRVSFLFESSLLEMSLLDSREDMEAIAASFRASYWPSSSLCRVWIVTMSYEIGPFENMLWASKTPWKIGRRVVRLRRGPSGVVESVMMKIEWRLTMDVERCGRMWRRIEYGMLV